MKLWTNNLTPVNSSSPYVKQKNSNFILYQKEGYIKLCSPGNITRIQMVIIFSVVEAYLKYMKQIQHVKLKISTKLKWKNRCYYFLFIHFSNIITMNTKTFMEKSMVNYLC